MDAKERLRRYLEQRRELGESEMVLDSMPVDDVLAMLGALRGGTGAAKSARARSAPSDTVAPPPRHDDAPPRLVSPEVSVAHPVAPAPPTVRFEASASTDWRETLRRSGVAGTNGPAVPGSGGSATGEPPPATASPKADARQAPQSSEVPAHRVASSPELPSWLATLDLPFGITTPALRGSETDHVTAWPSLDALAQHVAGCARCSLAQSATHPVPGEGNPRAEFLCVGEAPGASEDEQGRPFVGEAGELLTKILGAIQLTRDDVYICNVLKHRPPGNRDPLPEEVAACQPYLTRQLELVQPRVILALGRFAAQTLLQTTAAIGALRGKVHRYGDIPVIVTYHPAALLRNEAWKRPTWEDVQLARRILDASRAARSAESV